MESHKLVIGGDIFPCHFNNTLFFNGVGLRLYGEKILSLFHSADYSIVNLEGVLTNSKEKQEKTGPVIKSSPEAVNGLKALGISSVALANNHITDAGNTGCKDTISILEKDGIEWVGVGTSDNMKDHLSFKLGDTRICIYNVSEVFWNEPSSTVIGANIYDEYVVCNKLRELKQSNDLVIVIYHGGAERFCYPTPLIRRQCHRMADSGADVIITQHSHCIGCEEYYNDSYILYGQGNFIFKNNRKDCELEPTLHGLLIELDIQGKEYTVKKHSVSVNPNDFTASYDEVQDFSDFNERTAKNKDVEWVNEEFKRNKEWKVLDYLFRLMPISKFWKRLYGVTPSLTKKLLIKSFSRKQLLILKDIIHSSRSNETMYEAIDIIAKKHYKNKES